MNPHFLQSDTWQTFKQNQGTKTFTATTETWHYLALLETTPLGNYLYTPYGPTLATKSALKSALKSLKTLAKDQKAIFIRLEPTLPYTTSEMKKYHAIKTKNQSAQHTLILDLSAPSEEILNNMKPNNRNLYRNYIKKGIKITQTQDPAKISILYKLMQKVTAHNHFSAHSQTYLKNQLASSFATLYIAKLNGHPIAASLVYDTKTTRYYAQAAADYEHRNLSAGTILVAQMILDAKNQGQKFFDFWGVTPSEDPKHPWYGFTKFKKSFVDPATPITTYSGTYDIPVNPLKYQLYRLIRTLNLALRRLIRTLRPNP